MRNSAISPGEAQQILSAADELYSATEVEAAIDEMARRINTDLAGKTLLMVCILNGGLVMFGRLARQIALPLEVDYIHASRYGVALTGSRLNWIAGPQRDPAGQVVLLVDDILDEGTTLAEIKDAYQDKGATEIYTAVLTLKQRKRTNTIQADYVGLEVPDRYVFGYGMDYKGYLRNAPGIYAEKNK